MIKLYLEGAMGNQMFEYAAARAISREYGNEKIVISNGFSYYKYIQHVMTSKRFRIALQEYSLRHFNIKADIKKMPEIAAFLAAFRLAAFRLAAFRLTEDLAWQRVKFAGDIKERLENNHRRGYITCIDNQVYYPITRTEKRIKHVLGLWQTEKYFYKIKEEIREELRVITPPNEFNKAMLAKISGCNAVCVHLRRGDYVSNPMYSRYLNVTQGGYFINAMRYIAGRVENPVFFIFSDEIGWVRENINFEFPVEYSKSDNPDYEDMRLMYNCKHFIMSNSTFSWWGSYLSDYPNKIVIIPSVWDKRRENAVLDIFREDMIKMDNEGNIIE